MGNDLNEWKELFYNGQDLGANYNKEYTVFKVWAPTREDIKVVIYDDYKDSCGKIFPMIKGDKGVWELKLEGDYKNKYYNYIVIVDGMEVETPDPYTKAATANGVKGMVVDLSTTNPKGWESHQKPIIIKASEAVIYEMHVKDFSIDEDSGMKNKGKYLAFTEKGSKSKCGISTGLDHLKNLGITHIHLLPVFDFASVDETDEVQYNWGYDPYLYNVPEGSYSTNPYDGSIRIKEFKEMIKALHENGLSVIMDVVYNHTFSMRKNPFEILEPKYYYRTDTNGRYTNGSGCGNETASERSMMRKFIVDSVKFWATEYKIDGFRFDLIALHDIETIKEVLRELKKINPRILVYGEPWTGGDTPLPYDMQFRKGKQRGMDISVFNDDFRNSLKGDNDGTYTGFVNGRWGLEWEIKKGIVGSIQYGMGLYGFAEHPIETINYVSSHDNLTLFDKIEKSNSEATDKERERMNRLALSIILTSQGIPFIQGGTEFLRTKKGNHNSYNAGDEINKICWSRKHKYNKTFEYIKGLIAIRKGQRVMTLDKAEDVRNSIQFLGSPENSVAYLLNSPYEEDHDHILIIHNANRNDVKVGLPLKGEWKVIANEFEANHKGVTHGIKVFRNEVSVPSISTYILYKNIT
ncbi:type I pullulanase [Wukongibacter baidiensis]|uniref:type I pullulanase n=1 Tax=Wukongibacter baidiensis TaxID=1723361 RepID=UPI003D7F2EBA